MIARCRIVHYITDPFLGGRVPLAAIVESGGTVSLLEAPHIPGAKCLGSRAGSANIRVILEDLRTTIQFDALPVAAGPHAIIGDPINIPAEVADPKKWTQELLRRGREKSSSASERHGSIRATYGIQFLRQYSVDRLIKRTFEPKKDLNGWFKSAYALGSISQYVEGRDEVLLMEPLVPARRQWVTDLKSVAERFGAYRCAAGSLRSPLRPRLLAYVLSGGSTENRATIGQELAPFADTIVDTDDTQQRAKFVEQIRATAASAGLLH